MYRITGDTTWQDKGWEMFESIIAATQTQAGHSAINDVLVPGSAQSNEMESFWLAETLKYFYLLYSSPDVISLDDWVLNTEAHPFRRPDASAKAKAAEL
jgi:mannosyl-oligosaccharide alpha-1,2-mannosidase